jgi:hypothetical protein
MRPMTKFTRTEKSLPGDIHVTPVMDYREHETSSNCWCLPEFDDEDGRIWVHNSMDRREGYEGLPPEKLN